MKIKSTKISPTKTGIKIIKNKIKCSKITIIIMIIIKMNFSKKKMKIIKSFSNHQTVSSDFHRKKIIFLMFKIIKKNSRMRIAKIKKILVKMKMKMMMIYSNLKVFQNSVEEKKRQLAIMLRSKKKNKKKKKVK